LAAAIVASVTRVIGPVIAPGSLSRSEQPTMIVDAGLLLRPWQAGDAPVVVDAFTTPDIQRWHVRTCGSVSEAQTWLNDEERARRTEHFASWAITTQNTDLVLGRVAIYPDLRAGRGEISYWVLPQARGARVATRAAVAAPRRAHQVGLGRVELEHSTRNEPSRRVARAAGFIEESIRRQSTLHADGWHDMRLYAHLVTDPTPSENDAG
jgi:ribosomal-protein-alanine N-acetyltransferase